jgi:glycosyltransferase involved in cell wall biosynthesis
MLLANLREVKLMKKNSDKTRPDNPYLSIVIPLHNAEMTLAKCLNAIFSSSFHDFEVLVVDDCSTDNSLSIAESFPCKIMRLNYNQGPSVARNRGAKDARGEVILFIDSDVVIQRDTLSLFVDSLKTYPAVFGIYTQRPGTPNLLSLYQNFYAHKSIKETKELTSMLYSYCVAINRKVFNELGGFDQTWVRPTFEDVELGLRLTESGHQIYLNKNIEVVHYPNFNMHRFIKNYFYKSLDLSKFMFGKGKTTLNDEGWTNRKNLISLIAGILVIPSLILSLFSQWFIILFFVASLIFLATNIDFYGFILREKPRALFHAIFLNLMVQNISALGIITGLVSYIKEKGQHENS